MAVGLRAAGRPPPLEPWTAGPASGTQKSEPGHPGVEAEAPPRPAPHPQEDAEALRARWAQELAGTVQSWGSLQPLAPAAQQAERRRRGAVQPERARSRPSAYLCAAVLASRMPAPCIQERTEPRPAGSSGSSFRFSPPRGRASCAGNIRARSRWALPQPGIRSRRGCGSSQLRPPDGTRRLQERSAAPVPAAQCAPASWALPRRKRVRERRRCPLPSRGAGRGDGGISPRPERRRAD